jgi:hypothetical protein
MRRVFSYSYGLRAKRNDGVNLTPLIPSGS